MRAQQTATHAEDDLLAFVQRVADARYEDDQTQLIADARRLMSTPDLPACDECGGTGADSGALYEPEPCPVCLGSGTFAAPELIIASKPMGRETATPPARIAEEAAL